MQWRAPLGEGKNRCDLLKAVSIQAQARTGKKVMGKSAPRWRRHGERTATLQIAPLLSPFRVSVAEAAGAFCLCLCLLSFQECATCTDWVVGGPFGRFSVLKNKDGLDETVETELAAIDSQIELKTTATATKKQQMNNHLNLNCLMYRDFFKRRKKKKKKI